MNAAEFRHNGEQLPVPLVPQIRPGRRIEVGNAPFPVYLQFIKKCVVVKRRTFQSDQHGLDALFLEQVDHEAFPTCARLCRRASIMSMTVMSALSCGTVISFPSIF